MTTSAVAKVIILMHDALYIGVRTFMVARLFCLCAGWSVCPRVCLANELEGAGATRLASP